MFRLVLLSLPLMIWALFSAPPAEAQTRILIPCPNGVPCQTTISGLGRDVARAGGSLSLRQSLHVRRNCDSLNCRPERSSLPRCRGNSESNRSWLVYSSA